MLSIALIKIPHGIFINLDVEKHRTHPFSVISSSIYILYI